MKNFYKCIVCGFIYLFFSLPVPPLSSFLFSLQQLPVITSNTIVRCRSCRTYINPFVSFLDQRRWKCNLCFRVNDGENKRQRGGGARTSGLVAYTHLTGFREVCYVKP